MSGHNNGAVLEGRVTTRGTSNSNERGNAEDRRRRRQWLVDTWRADTDGVLVRYLGAPEREDLSAPNLWVPIAGQHQRMLDMLDEDSSYEVLVERVPLCRCYRCPRLLTVETVTVDRVVPGCKGGTYRRNNIRPACGDCNSETGARLRR